VSWRVLIPDLAAAYDAAGRQGPALAPEPVSFRRWARTLAAQAEVSARTSELNGWTSLLEGAQPLLGSRTPGRDRNLPGSRPDGPHGNGPGSVRLVTAEVAAEVTSALLTTVPAVFHGGVDDVLLAGLAAAVSEWRSRRGAPHGPVLVDVEGHGREPLTAGLDLSRTVGWLTSVHPVRLDAGAGEAAGVRAGGPAAGRVVKRVKEQLRAVPGDGLGYGLLRYLNPRTGPALAAMPGAQLGFNYLGRFTTASPAAGGDRGTAPASGHPAELRSGRTDAAATWRQLGLGGDADEGLVAAHVVEVNAIVRDGPDGPSLRLVVSWSGDLVDQDAATELAGRWRDMLHGLAEHVAHPGAGGHTPSDFPLAEVSQAELDEFEAMSAEIEKGTPA
jgi:non-ribosomal peptide synthase protein (TIGR01720 family)